MEATRKTLEEKAQNPDLWEAVNGANPYLLREDLPTGIVTGNACNVVYFSIALMNIGMISIVTNIQADHDE